MRLGDGIQCDVRGVSDAQYPFALHYFTGSKAHNIAMRKRAIDRGLKLNEYALEGPNGPVKCKTEEDLYAALDLAYIPPELREDWGEIAVAERGPLPSLIELDDLTGTFHCHTDWSDGGATLEEMAEAAREAGLHYLGIADHSRVAAYARRPLGRSRPQAVGRDRRTEREVRQDVPPLQGHRVRHPDRRIA